MTTVQIPDSWGSMPDPLGGYRIRIGQGHINAPETVWVKLSHVPAALAPTQAED